GHRRRYFSRVMWAATCSSGPIEDEGLDLPVAGPRPLLGVTGIEFDAVRPYLFALARCGEPGGGIPGIALDRHPCHRVGLEVVIPAGVSSIAVVSRDDGHAVGMRNAQKRYGAWLPRLSACGGENDRRQARRDPGEATPAPGEFTD